MEELQFDRVEPGEHAVPVAAGSGEFRCAFCSTPLFSSYYELNGRAACEGCRYRVEETFNARPGVRGFLRAAFAGLAAAAVGCALYYGVRAVTGYEIGLIAILVGYMVGRSVRWGTGNKGGRAYQVLAVLLTYLSISSTYLPAIFQGIKDDIATKKPAAAVASTATPGNPAAAKAGAAAEEPEKIELSAGAVLGLVAAFLFLASAGPIFAGMKSPILLLIVGFGLWEAWKINRRIGLDITGPLQVGAVPGPAPVG